MLKIDENKCRLTNRNSSHNSAEFNRLACASCYDYMSYVFADFDKEFILTDNGYLQSDFNETLDLNLDDHVKTLNERMNSTVLFRKWSECCQAAKKCCSNVMSNLNLGYFTFFQQKKKAFSYYIAV